MRSKIMILFFIVGWIPSSIFAGDKKFSKNSFFINLSGHIGTQSYYATTDPFDKMLPISASAEIAITDHIGVGTTFTFYKWSDYLGIFGGKFTFQTIQPAVNIVYHFNFNKLENLDLCVGQSLGYSFLSITNELGNDYLGPLKSGLYAAPFLGFQVYFLNRLSASLKLYWSVIGDYSGISGAIGITYIVTQKATVRIKPE
ncbi:MAG: hypothetical protein WCC06_06305 [Candidatus Aminicenantales bacterium]